MHKFSGNVSTSQRGDLMDNVVHLKEFQWQKRFNDEVIPFFEHLNLPCQHFRHQSEGLCVVKNELYLFIFLTFVEKNEPTTLPSIVDRFYDIKHNPRVSKGEWVVEHIYQVDEKHTKKLMDRLKRYQGDPNGIIELKNNMKE